MRHADKSHYASFEYTITILLLLLCAWAYGCCVFECMYWISVSLFSLFKTMIRARRTSCEWVVCVRMPMYAWWEEKRLGSIEDKIITSLYILFNIILANVLRMWYLVETSHYFVECVRACLHARAFVRLFPNPLFVISSLNHDFPH